MKLEGAKALVTGGSSGIGLGIAKALKDRGAEVAISARDEARLKRAAETIGAHPIPGDVSVEADAKRMVAGVIEAFGDYDVLINNAGFGRFSPLKDLDMEDFQSILATNVLGAAMMARESARHFVSRGGGNIVNIGSTAAHRGFAGGSAYVASKFALTGLTECWRAELRKHDIRVMQVNPSEVLTEFFSGAGREQPPSERKLRPQEIAHAVVSMLEMDDRGFITDLSVWATNPD